LEIKLAEIAEAKHFIEELANFIGSKNQAHEALLSKHEDLVGKL
jgi:hypothetical protein